MNITFTASTISDLTSQIRAFLGEPAPTSQPMAVRAGGAGDVPSWAPQGSAWLAMPGAPVLLGPDGVAIPVEWRGSAAYPGIVEHKHDAAAEAQGAALLESIRG